MSDSVIKGGVLVREKPYVISERTGYKFITMPKDLVQGSKFKLWRFPDGKILLVPSD